MKGKKMKNLLISVSLFFIVSDAVAQQQPPVADYSLKLNSNEIDILGRALGKLPYEEVAVLIQKIRQQIISQQQPEPPKEAPK